MENCIICGEPVINDRAEMYDPDRQGHGPEHFSAQNADFQAPEDYTAASGIVHAECGLQKGWEIA